MLASAALQIRVGHSPDPDDAFMYWALTTDLVDTRGHEFEQVLGDIQTLNQWARAGRLEVTAISLAAYPFVQEDYALLPHGASIGSGYGPIVVAREPKSLDELRELEIVVPGAMTTSFLVLRLVLDAFPRADWPPVLRVRTAFQVMVGAGSAMALAALAVIVVAAPTPSSEASRRVSTTKATDHPIAFGRDSRLGDGVAVNGDREAEGRGRR